MKAVAVTLAIVAVYATLAANYFATVFMVA